MFINNLIAYAYFNYAVPYVTIQRFVGSSKMGFFADSVYKAGVHFALLAPFQGSGILGGSELIRT